MASGTRLPAQIRVATDGKLASFVKLIPNWDDVINEGRGSACS